MRPSQCGTFMFVRAASISTSASLFSSMDFTNFLWRFRSYSLQDGQSLADCRGRQVLYCMCCHPSGTASSRTCCLTP